MATYPVPPPARRRTMGSLFLGAACVNAAMTVAGTAATLLVADRLGTGWAGLGSTAGVAGTAAGVLLLSRVMARHGRRTGLRAGALTGTGGAAVATAGAAAGSVAVLLAGMLLLGVGNAAAQLARYAAADEFTAGRRATALGAVVWAGTVGAVGGPLLLGPATGWAGRSGWPPLTGAFALALACLAAAVVAFALVARRPPADRDEAGLAAAWPLRALLARPDIRLALTAMLTAQVVMTAVMTAAPLSMHQHGQPMGMVGLVVSTHTLGMFALAPVSGRLADRFGGRTVVAAGLATLALAGVLVTGTAGSTGPGLPVALFVLGYGWNLAFVGASSLLVRGLPGAVEARVQGLVESWSWAGGGAATLGSTAVLGAAGYPPLALGAGALVVVPAALLVAHRRRPPARQPQPEPERERATR
ncbi:MFS transporter [Actinocatenispora comari]|uniref:MFS transporter n=1 Tax=Actinocatenispora comari TaxID=2807577 RepID=A0A8J4EQ08_9ACTN|nr:MFS transporter [Actinocatenispora comari]GIL29274.1 MFS transporter [Actinocatenispora comari]